MQISTARNLSQFAAAVALLLFTNPVWAQAPQSAKQRPISDFVEQQGTFDIGFLFVPPVENFLGWVDPDAGLGISVDYAGLADLFAEGAFGTTFSGKVTERPLADGRAEVTVVLRTQNALTWVIPFDTENPGDNPFGDNETIFGARVTEIDESNPPLLGDSLLKLKFINSEVGADLPDLIELAFFTEDLKSVEFHADAVGFLPDGSLASVRVDQVGVFTTAVADGFPVERIKVTVLGP